MPDKYAFQETDGQADKQKETAISKRHRFAAEAYQMVPHCRVLSPGEFDGTIAVS